MIGGGGWIFMESEGADIAPMRAEEGLDLIGDESVLGEGDITEGEWLPAIDVKDGDDG